MFRMQAESFDAEKKTVQSRRSDITPCSRRLAVISNRFVVGLLTRCWFWLTAASSIGDRTTQMAARNRRGLLDGSVRTRHRAPDEANETTTVSARTTDLLMVIVIGLIVPHERRWINITRFGVRTSAERERLTSPWRTVKTWPWSSERKTAFW